MKTIECGGCGTTLEVESFDKMPQGWYGLFVYDDDDGNVYPSQDVCSPECLIDAAVEAKTDLEEE